MPRRPAAGSVTAKTIATSAFEPEVMNCLVPFSTQRLPRRCARVFNAAASEPACGSVRQNAASFSPLASGTVPFGRVGREQVLRDVARGVAQETLFFGESHALSLIGRASFIHRFCLI